MPDRIAPTQGVQPAANATPSRNEDSSLPRGSRSALAGLLFFSYALGLGLPFILLALAYGRMTGLVRRLNAHARVVSIVSGLFLIAIGLLLVTDGFTRLAALAPPIEPPFVS